MHLPLRSALQKSLALLSGFVALSMPVAVLASQTHQTHYHVVARQHLEGGLKWDYLTEDPVRHHLFITHGDHVDVYDTMKHRVMPCTCEKELINTHICGYL